MPSVDLSVHSNVPPRLLDRNGLRIRKDVLYTDAKGREKNKLRKRVEEAFDDFGEILRRVLEPNETIFYVARAQAMPGAFAQFFGGGWHTYSLPGALLFFTQRRIIALRVRKRRGGWIWDRGIRTLRWGDLASVKSAGFLTRYLTLTFRAGGKQTYWRFSSGNLKKTKMLIDVLLPNGSGEMTQAAAMVSLCPTCFAILSAGKYECQACGLRFKDENTLVRRGILIPGGATFYVGAPVLGVLRAVTESILLVFGGLMLLAVLVTASEYKDPVGGAFGGLLVLGLLALDKSAAIIISRQQIRDFLPAK